MLWTVEATLLVKVKLWSSNSSLDFLLLLLFLFLLLLFLLLLRRRSSLRHRLHGLGWLGHGLFLFFLFLFFVVFLGDGCNGDSGLDIVLFFLLFVVGGSTRYDSGCSEEGRGGVADVFFVVRGSRGGCSCDGCDSRSRLRGGSFARRLQNSMSVTVRSPVEAQKNTTHLRRDPMPRIIQSHLALPRPLRRLLLILVRLPLLRRQRRPLLRDDPQQLVVRRERVLLLHLLSDVVLVEQVRRGRTLGQIRVPLLLFATAALAVACFAVGVRIGFGGGVGGLAFAAGPGGGSDSRSDVTIGIGIGDRRWERTETEGGGGDAELLQHLHGHLERERGEAGAGVGGRHGLEDLVVLVGEVGDLAHLRGEAG
jgi:hypothetical protein